MTGTTSTPSVERNIDAAKRFLDRVASLSPEQRSEVSKNSFGSAAHTSAMLTVVDEVTVVRNKDRDGRVGAFLVEAERKVDELGLGAELGGLVKGAARALLVSDTPGMEKASRQLYTPFESVIPFNSVRD
jgi:hypothetical protein